MPDIEAKCTALLLYHMYLQGQRNGTVTAAWLQTWNVTDRQANPLRATKFLTKLAYLYVYAINVAYITPPEQDEPPPPMLPQTYLRHTTQYGIDTERDTGPTDHDTTPNHPVV